MMFGSLVILRYVNPNAFRGFVNRRLKTTWLSEGKRVEAQPLKLHCASGFPQLGRRQAWLWLSRGVGRLAGTETLAGHVPAARAAARAGLHTLAGAVAHEFGLSFAERAGYFGRTRGGVAGRAPLRQHSRRATVGIAVGFVRRTVAGGFASAGPQKNIRTRFGGVGACSHRTVRNSA